MSEESKGRGADPGAPGGDGPRARLVARLAAGEALVAGVMSGTSADGIDVALLRPRPDGAGGLRARAVGFETVPFAPDLAARLRRLLDDPDALVGLGEVARLDRDLGLAFGDAARRVAAAHGLALDLVGSHGQTLWHHDGRRGGDRGLGATLQLGDGDFLAEAAGCAVVADLRRRDLAVGGEGAPLLAAVDPWLLGVEDDERLGVLNLGGYGNLTLLAGRRVVGNLDTGPAGALLDGLARALLGRARDDDGAVAATGRVDAALVEAWLAAPGHGGAPSLGAFLGAPPPRSTGRDTYGEPWVAAHLAATGVRQPADLLATGCAVVAACVARTLALPDLAPRRPDTLLLAGGGLHNRTLVAALAAALPGVALGSTADRGVDPDAREALGFGLLAAAHLLELPVDPGPTGARRAALLGKASPAPLG